MDIDPQTAVQMLQAQLQPWYSAVESPATIQEQVLEGLLADYAQTEYGAQYGAARLGSIDEYRRTFPVAGYDVFWPILQKVMAGDVSLLLKEPPVGWAITRGTTGGEAGSKYIPMTATDLKLRVSAGRAAPSWVMAHKVSHTRQVRHHCASKAIQRRTACAWTGGVFSWTAMLAVTIVCTFT